ncbi:Fur family transcriptional regulator [Cellulosimicrobium cellulans]|uniref:Fur family transcriptional regulator n=1 Tax=Cellulosimicrobium cellulans TaxID=1710 RepID=UPI0020CE1E9A|nr:transcriptional repressor [Cellulosimicrobium cellulans]
MADDVADTLSHAGLHAAPGPETARRVEEMLRGRGARVTAARRSVVAALAAHHEPLGPEQVVALAAEDGVHRASVYRALDALADLGAVERRLRPGGRTAYHLTALDPQHAHVHLVCDACGAIDVLHPADLAPVVELARRLTGFEVDPRRSALTGLCADCGAGGAHASGAPDVTHTTDAADGADTAARARDARRRPRPSPYDGGRATP